MASLEGPAGYFAMFEDDVDSQGAADALGQVHRITEVSWKPFPTGRAAQGGVTLVQALRDQGLSADNLESLTLSAPPIIPRLVARPIPDGMTPNYARLCFPYLGAITLLRGTVGLADFTEDDLSSEDIRALAARISVVENRVSDPAAFTPQTATATLKDGSELTAHADRLFGSPAAPLTREQHLAKFRDCAGFGLRGVKAQGIAERLIGLTDGLDALSDCAELFALAAGDTT